MARGFAKVSTGNVDVNRLEEKIRVGLKQGLTSVESSISSIQEGPGGGVLIEDITLTSTPTDFRHGLGRVWKGYQVVKTDTDIGIPVSGNSADNKQFINLMGSAATATVSIWVF
jgi:hypothetical protein